MLECKNIWEKIMFIDLFLVYNKKIKLKSNNITAKGRHGY
jgi:hypothetical protein